MSTLTYSCTEKDYESFNQAVQDKQNSNGHVIVWIIMIVVGTVLYNILRNTIQEIGYYPANTFVQTVIGVGWALGIVFLSCVLQTSFSKRRILSRDGSFLSQQTLQITPAGISCEKRFYNGFIDWRGVLDIQETKDYFLFYTDRISACLVPKTAFKKSADADNFLARAYSYWKKEDKGKKTGNRVSQLTFTLTEQDFQSLINILCERNGQSKWDGWWGWLYMLIMLSILVMLIQFLTGMAGDAGYYPTSPFMKATLFIIMVYFAFCSTFRSWSVFSKRFSLDQQGSFLARKKFKMTSKGISEESDYHKGYADWQGVLDIQETTDCLLFYIDVTSAYVVPKSAFEKAEDAIAFLKKSRRHWMKARASTKKLSNRQMVTNASMIGKVTYSRTEKDFIRFDAISGTGLYQRHRSIAMFVAIGVGTTLSYLLISVSPSSEDYPASPVTLVVVCYGMVLAAVLSIGYFMNKRQAQHLQEECVLETLTINAKGISVVTDYCESFSDWQGIIDIQETKDYLLFYVDWTQAYLLPKAVFSSKEDVAAFLETAQVYCKKALIK